MKVSRLISDAAPVLIEHWLASQAFSSEEEKEAQRQVALSFVHSAADSALAAETDREINGKAQFVAQLAAEILHGAQGEPTEALADEAVHLAHRILTKSLALCAGKTK